MRRFRVRSHTAIVVVIALMTATVGAVLAPAAGAGGSASKSVTLQALCTRGEAEGCTSEVTVGLNPGGDSFRVSFSEDEVAGTGDQWRAAGWNAATTATLLLGTPLDGTVEYEINGEIDGPSAGALMTVGVLSLLRGDKVNKDVTMTGAINPDGTIGPVGGIPLKVDGAVEAKKTLMLIPDGQRNSEDPDGNLVDVVDIGEEAGVEVQEVADIYEAYEAFTGEELPRLADTNDTELSSQAYDKLENLTDGWYTEFDGSTGEFGALDPAIQGLDVVVGFVQQADDARNVSDELRQEGIQAGAYVKAVEAAAFANSAVKSGQALQIYTTQGIDAFVSQIEASASVRDKADQFFNGLDDFKPKNLSEAAGLIEAYGIAIDAISLSEQAESAFAAAEEAATEDEIVGGLIQGALISELAGTLIDYADELQEFSSSLPGPKVKNAADLDSIADFFRKAADANLEAFDTLIVAPEAEAAGVAEDDVRNYLADADTDYLLALQGSGIIGQTIDEFVKDKTAAAYANLGGASSLYTKTASLLVKYYALGAILDDSGSVVGVSHEQALLNSLNTAAEQASGVIGGLKDKQADAALVTANYEVAGVDREGDVESKLGALSGLYGAYISGRLLAYLGGFQTAGLS